MWWPAGGFLTTEYSVLESFFYVQVRVCCVCSVCARVLATPDAPCMSACDDVCGLCVCAQLFKFSSAARAGRTVHDLEGPWFIDSTDWPDLHWDMNLQQTYYFPIAANRPDEASTLTTFLSELLATRALARSTVAGTNV